MRLLMMQADTTSGCKQAAMRLLSEGSRSHHERRKQPCSNLLVMCEGAA